MFCEFVIFSAVHTHANTVSFDPKSEGVSYICCSQGGIKGDIDEKSVCEFVL